MLSLRGHLNPILRGLLRPILTTEQGRREGLTSSDRERLKELERERENRELRRANDILRTAMVFRLPPTVERLFTRPRYSHRIVMVSDFSRTFMTLSN